MENRDLYLAAYDISSPQRAHQVLQIVKGYATGGQKSVYECFLSPAEKADLVLGVQSVIDARFDRFLLVRLDPRSRVYTLGIAVPPQDPPFFYWS